MNDTGVNQDACQGATLTLHLDQQLVRCHEGPVESSGRRLALGALLATLAGGKALA